MSDKINRVTFSELLDVNSKNFMGSGLTFEEWLATGNAIKYTKSWQNQDRDERKRRLHFIAEMVREKDNIIKRQGTFSTMWCDVAIESVVCGDIEGIETAIHVFNLNGEDKAIRDSYNFNKFLELCSDFIITSDKSIEKT